MKRKISLLFILFYLFSVYGFAQKIHVKGIIQDETSEPMVGVSVKVVNKTTGTISGLDGDYALDVENGDVLEFSFIGYVTQRITVKGQTKIDVTMSEDSKVLDEVIVTGYGSVSKKNLTTAIVKVDTDKITKTGTSNLSQLLMGRAAGLQASMSSAQPGGNVSITIRGGGTPIYIVDGVIMPSSSLEATSGGYVTALPSSVDRSGLAGVNPEDIESIEVLKDASAAIYGVTSANGVILVTTKKGKEGKTRVSYDGAMSFVDNYDYLETMNAKDYMTYVNIFRKEQYLYNNKQGAYGSDPYDGGSSEAFSASDIANAQHTDWVDHVLRNGSISSHNVTIQGGTQSLQYYFSGKLYSHKGSVANSKMDRYNLRSTVSAQILPFLKATSNISYVSSNNQNGTVGNSSEGRGDAAAGALASALLYPSNLPVYQDNGNYTVFTTIPNPVALQKIQNTSLSDGINLNFTLDFDIIKNMLTAKLLYGYNKETSKRNAFIPSGIFFDLSSISRGNLQNSFRSNSTLEGTINFTKSFFEDQLRVDALVGMGRYINKSDGVGIAYNEINDLIGNDNIGAATGSVLKSSYRTESERRSQFGKVSFDILDKYVVSGTLRRDGTDKFFPDKKYALFPSVSVAWKVFNEKFMENIAFVDLLKLRASYGVTGNDNIGLGLYGSYSAFSTHVFFDENSSKHIPMYLATTDHPYVTWEKTIMKNIGIDFSILNDRISGSFDYFWNDVTDMLTEANTKNLSMLAVEPINGGHIRRYGWDATINTKNILTRDFKWTSSISLSHYNAIWKERFDNYVYSEYQIRKDEPVSAWYFYRTSGIINSSKSNIPAHQPADYQKPGCPIFVDVNGDGELTIDDIVMENTVPDLYMGLGNTFSYKNWDLDIYAYAKLGVKRGNILYDWSNPTNLASQLSNVATVTKDSYNSQTNENGTLPGIAYRLTTTRLPGNAGTDISMEDASFLRIRNITLGYNFSKKDLGILGKYISIARLYADIQNPFTFTKYSVFDPELSSGDGAGTKSNYPMARTYSVGVKLSF